MAAPSQKIYAGRCGEKYAGMMELADMLDLGSSAAMLVGSSPTTRTKPL